MITKMKPRVVDMRSSSCVGFAVSRFAKEPESFAFSLWYAMSCAKSDSKYSFRYLFRVIAAVMVKTIPSDPIAKRTPMPRTRNISAQKSAAWCNLSPVKRKTVMSSAKRTA